MMTLTEFLTARLDEDEAVARAATPGPWSAHGGGVDGSGHQPVVMGGFDSAGSLQDASTDSNAGHIARHDPARVLREVEAKRTLLEGDRWWPDWHDTSFEGEGIVAIAKILAAVYADHEAYREEWKP